MIITYWAHVKPLKFKILAAVQEAENYPSACIFLIDIYDTL
jgi:hypothetical protein